MLSGIYFHLTLSEVCCSIAIKRTYKRLKCFIRVEGRADITMPAHLITFKSSFGFKLIISLSPSFLSLHTNNTQSQFYGYEVYLQPECFSVQSPSSSFGTKIICYNFDLEISRWKPCGWRGCYWGADLFHHPPIWNRLSISVDCCRVSTFTWVGFLVWI